jgi:hypothetical protein
MTTDDRRAPGAARISFDGLVEVGGALGPSFEAQAVNVSEDGMQLRTAYLPELGQQVTCRFETTPGQGVVTSGEVVWSRGADTGGEFGIRFTEVDPESVDALKRVCGVAAAAAAGQPGAKVRLYIDGLASPMRAKVRDARPAAITVGSDLGFLQVGKHIELEDAQSGNKRPASIDRVEVTVDPSSNIPQLVVTLRYADTTAEAAGGLGADVRGQGYLHDSDARPKSSEDPSALDDASARFKGAFARHAAGVGPAFKRFAHRAKVTLALLAKRRLLDEDSMPRRTTAPAPGGGLHTSGRRVVRGESGAPADGAASATVRRSQHGDEEAAVQAKPSAMKRKAVVATAVMMTAVLGALAIKRSHHDGAGGPAGASTGADTAPTTSATAPAMPTSAPQPVVPPSTLAAPANTLVAVGEKPATTSMTAAEEANGHGTEGRKHPRPAPFGNGPVHHGNVLRLKMDGTVESIEGAQQPSGFTVKLPGRRSLEAAAPLAARDSRIAAIKVSNEPSGAELSVAFRDGVPNYQVSARGDTLVIALAAVGPLEAPMAKREDKSVNGSKHAKRGPDLSPER